MKKIGSIVFVFLVVVLLVSCSTATPKTKADEISFIEGGNSNYSIVVDTETGCEYIESYGRTVNGLAVSITPRLENGVPICNVELP
ncbi:hypothetical protein [Psychrobacillus sp. FSL H8-0510]|uniref:hypothetical protein n=1 Tax=Psychrobacillus sp. FSL H8-0510 TaxID=2921394 RepID=UPI0030FCA74A